jgi:ABC-2 type transport system permease protein
MHALRVIYVIWLRELKAFVREKGRIIGMIGQPLLYLLIVGQGIASGMSLNRSADFDYLKYIYPGIIGMSVLFTSIFSALSIIWDREFGFLKEVLVAPVPRSAVALGKICGGATIAMMQSAILIALAPFVGVTLSVLVVLQLFLVCFLISFAVTSLGVLIAARMRSMQGFQMLMNFLIMPLYFLSGAMFPLVSAPRWMQTLMRINPLTYGVDALRNVIYSETTTVVAGNAVSLAEMARQSGLIRWQLGTDLGLCTLVAGLLAGLAAYVFSTAD